MAHYTLMARINAGGGKFPFVNVRFSKNHCPIPIVGATYYLRPSRRGKRTPIKIGKDLYAAHSALMDMEGRATQGEPRSSIVSPAGPRKTLAEAAHEFLERGKQKSHRTYLGYRKAVAALNKGPIDDQFRASSGIRVAFQASTRFLS